ncbi:hypothetical protein F0562_023582 [Nyssa sinensis]|uniref:Uncharacterized protein n=1 Tax=Nyssa sinensis TaxID=561372 RepID=A0A5J5BKQ1_9ASTE|nr:hypothetical protein F0562_023582 [Nyssa sinensis]
MTTSRGFRLRDITVRPTIPTSAVYSHSTEFRVESIVSSFLRPKFQCSTLPLVLEKRAREEKEQKLENFVLVFLKSEHTKQKR